MKRILFSNPPWFSLDTDGVTMRAGIRAGSRWPFSLFTGSRPDAPRIGEYMPFPMFMSFAAAYAEKHTGLEVIMRDSICRRESYETYLDYVSTLQPDFVVIETATPSWEHDRTICQLIKDAHPATEIIVTGTIAKTQHEEIIKLGYHAVAGEYEKGVVRIVKGETGFINFDFLTTKEMNEAPYPMFDEEVALNYWDACPTGQKFPHLQLWTSRGCVFKCCFCSYPSVMTNDDPDGLHKRIVRYYTPEYIEGFIRHRLAITPGIASLYDDSDIFNLGDGHTQRMSAVFKGIGLPWTAMCRADTSRLPTWAIMQQAGCVGVKVGMESGSQRVIDRIINKKLALADVEERILPAIKATGMTVHTTWTVGLPGETADEAQETVAMITRLYQKGLHDTHQLSGTATIEGTPLDTLTRQTQALTAYPDATAKGFIMTGDGQAKIEAMQRELMTPRLK